jgi:hypothetical protein
VAADSGPWAFCGRKGAFIVVGLGLIALGVASLDNLISGGRELGIFAFVLSAAVFGLAGYFF